MRRTPKQERSQQSIQIIFQAVEKLLSESDLNGFTTSKLAEVSGFSIGSIYQYFSNKDAVLKTMAIAYNNRIIEEVESEIAELDPASDMADSVRDIVASVARHYGGKARWERTLLRIGWGMDQIPEFIETTNRIGRVIFASMEERHSQGKYLDIKLTDEKMFILTRAISGLIRSFVLEGRDLSENVYLIDQLQCISLAILYSNNGISCKCQVCAGPKTKITDKS